MCENNNDINDEDECLKVGCCHWDDGCWSSVGADKCEKGKSVIVS